MKKKAFKSDKRLMTIEVQVVEFDPCPLCGEGKAYFPIWRKGNVKNKKTKIKSRETWASWKGETK